MNPPPEKILVRGANWLGDAVMSTPALLRLRDALPQAHITLLTHEKLADLWQHHPAVDAVIAFAKDESVWSIAKNLRAQNFQAGLALPNSHRSALELWLARVPQRIGYAATLRNWLLTRPVPSRTGAVRMRKRSVEEIHRLVETATRASPQQPPATAHHIFQYLHLAAALGAGAEPLPPRLVVTGDEVEAAQKKFGLAGEQPLLGLNAGAEYGPAKRWPKDRFAAVASEVQRRTQARWLIFGGSGDAELCDSIAAELTAHTTRLTAPVNLAGKTTLRDLCVLLKLCRVVLTNDTGPMHVAAAVGTPVVAIFGSTSPELTAPGLPGDPRHRLLKSNAPCSPCYLRECPIDFRCMHGISVERVVEAVLSVWQSRP